MVFSRVCFELIRRLAAALVALVILASVSPALAEGALSNEQTLEAERLGEEGVSAFQAGQFDKALGPLTSGYELAGWGTIGVWLAKTHEKLSQPLEAYRIYSEVAASPVNSGEPAPFAAAREEAKVAVVRLEQACAVIELHSPAPVGGLVVEVGGETRKASKANLVAVNPGDVTVNVSWTGGKLPPQSLSLRPGQHVTIELAADSAPAKDNATVEAAKKGKGEAIVHNLDFNMVELTGWTLHDKAGKQICALPCKWSGTDPETLSVRQANQKLLVRIGRKHHEDPNLLVSVNPARGSKGLALGLGIPSGLLFVTSLLALPETDYPGIVGTSAGVFGAGFGVCIWWFIWSKSRPYLDYEVPEANAAKAPKKASIKLDFYGNGLGVRGTF